MTAQSVRRRGRVAAPGLAVGPLSRIENRPPEAANLGSPDKERSALAEAIARAGADLAALAATQTDDALQMLEFQLALLEDEALSGPAFAAIESGAPAAHAWRDALDAQISEYSSAEDEYFRARSADLADLRDRVSRALAGRGFIGAAAEGRHPRGRGFAAFAFPRDRPDEPGRRGADSRQRHQSCRDAGARPRRSHGRWPRGHSGK